MHKLQCVQGIHQLFDAINELIEHVNTLEATRKEPEEVTSAPPCEEVIAETVAPVRRRRRKKKPTNGGNKNA